MSFTPIDNLIDFDSERPQSSYSALTLHRKCPQAWLYRYGMRLTSLKDTPSPYLMIGRWWSLLQAVEALERGRNAESIVFVPRSLRDKDEKYDLSVTDSKVSDVLFAAQERWARVSPEDREEFLTEIGEPLPDRLANMFQTWHEVNSERFDRERPLGVEVFWKRELPRPEKDQAWSLLADPEAVPKMHLIGYIDELYFDRQRRMVVVKDGKAQKDIHRGTGPMDDLMDSQLQLYAWGISPKLKREGLDAPRAVSYDRITSVAPKTPQLTAAGKLGKSVTTYDLATYLKWAVEDTRPSGEEIDAIVAEALENGKPYTEEQLRYMRELPEGRVAGKFGDFYASGAKKGQPKFSIYEIDEKEVERLKGPGELARWTKRSADPINRRIVEAHLRSAVDTALDIFQTQQRAAKTGAAARNIDRRGCSWCDFADLCRAQLMGGSVGEYDLELFGLKQKAPRGEKAGRK